MKIYLKILLYFILITLPANSFAGISLYGCNISAIQPLNFGIININDTNPETAIARVSITCTSLLSIGTTTVSYTITAESGNSGNQTNRTMSSGSNTLSYNAYIDSGYSTIWGKGNSGTGIFSLSYNLGLLQSRTDNFTIYGKIPIQTISIAGTYTDNLTITLTY